MPGEKETHEFKAVVTTAQLKAIRITKASTEAKNNAEFIMLLIDFHNKTKGSRVV